MPRRILSSEFKLLDKSIKELIRKFLSREIQKEDADPINYTPDRYKLAAFRLLVHAEIEDYLEEMARQQISQTLADIKNKVNVLGILDFYALATHFQEALPLTCPYDHEKFAAKAEIVLNKGNQFIKNNNGIKSESFLILSLLRGKWMGQIDDTLATLLNDYGKDRGNVAHSSVRRVRTLMGPRHEVTSAQNLIKQLREYFYGH